MKHWCVLTAVFFFSERWHERQPGRPVRPGAAAADAAVVPPAAGHGLPAGRLPRLDPRALLLPAAAGSAR